MLFSMMVLNTIAAIVYILYVFLTIKIYQVIPERRVTKQESVSYKLILNNESLMAYRDIRLKFMKELSEVREAERIDCISLEPGEGIDIHEELFCKYSGTYFIGVDMIEIMDYFKIFRISFHMPQKMKLTVKPRIVSLDNIEFLTKEESHNSSLWGERKLQPDNEVRYYCYGDNKHYIHWKNSAKRSQLMVRSMAAEEITEYIVIMDGSMNRIKFEEKIICCDKLRETIIALVNYIYTSEYYVDVVLDCVFENEICTQKDFNELYDRLIDYGFGMEKKMSEKLYLLNQIYDEKVPFIFVTSSHSNVQENDIAELRKYRDVAVINVDMYETIEDIFCMES